MPETNVIFQFYQCLLMTYQTLSYSGDALNLGGHGMNDTSNLDSGVEGLSENENKIDKLTNLSSSCNQKRCARDGGASNIHPVANLESSILNDTKRMLSKSSLSENLGIDEQNPEKPKYFFLIVDDSGLNRKMMRKIVESQGHSFELAEDG